MTVRTAYTARNRPLFKATRSAVSLAGSTAPVSPPSQAIVAAVAQCGDIWEEREDGRVTRRFSREGLERGLAAAALPCALDRLRALDIQVIWNEAEGAIDAVIDLAPLRRVPDAADQVNRYAAARMRTSNPTLDASARAA